MSDLEAGLAASANSPVADTTPTTPDAVLDAAFAAPASDAPASSETPSTPTPEEKPAAAIAQPQEPAKSEGAKGEPPRERWDSILDNARRKAREDALAEHRDALEIVDRLRNDFTGTLAQLLEEGSTDPRFSEQVTSRAAAILSARRKAGQELVEPQPDVQWTAEDGSPVTGYSAEQLRKWHQWNAKQQESRILQQFQPLQQMQQQFQHAQERARMEQQATAIATERGAQWKDAPLFADHKDAILKRQAEIYAEWQQQATQGERRSDPVNDPWSALQRAYFEVIQTQALPKLQTQTAEQLQAVAARKRAGSASDPAASLPAQPRRPRTPDEALDQVFGAYGV